MQHVKAKVRKFSSDWRTVVGKRRCGFANTLRETRGMVRDVLDVGVKNKMKDEEWLIGFRRARGEALRMPNWVTAIERVWGLDRGCSNGLVGSNWLPQF